MWLGSGVAEAVAEAEKHLAAMEKSDINSFIDQNELIDWKSTNYFSGLTNGQQYQVVVRDAADPTRYKAALVTAVSSSGGGGGSLGSIISGESFTEKEEAQIIKKNQADDVVIESEKYIVIIPQVTLRGGD